MQVSSWTVAYESLFFSPGLEQKWNPEVLDGYRCDKTFTPVSEKKPLYLILFRRFSVQNVRGLLVPTLSFIVLCQIFHKRLGHPLS